MAGLADKGRLFRFILLHGNTTNSYLIALEDGIRETWRFIIESSYEFVVSRLVVLLLLSYIELAPCSFL
jgi:hypothetical protein